MNGSTLRCNAFNMYQEAKSEKMQLPQTTTAATKVQPPATLGGARGEGNTPQKDAPMKEYDICQRWGIGCWDVQNNEPSPKVPGRFMATFFGADRDAGKTGLPGLVKGLKMLCAIGWNVTLLVDAFWQQSFIEYMIWPHNITPMSASLLANVIPNDVGVASSRCENEGHFMFFVRQFPSSVGFDLASRFRPIWKANQDRFDWYFVTPSDISVHFDQLRMFPQVWNLFLGSPYLMGVLRYELYHKPDKGQYLLDFEQVFGTCIRELLFLDG